MPSPACEVKDGAGSYQSTTNGVNVTAGNTITIHLVSTAGVNTWSISCIGTDELSDAATVTSALSIDTTAKTATFTAPTAGHTYIFQSQVNGGVDVNGVAQSSYTTTFGVYVRTAANRRVHAINETFESSATFGWLADINDVIRNPSAASPTGTGFAHVTAGSLDAASKKVDLTSTSDVTAPSGTGLFHITAGAPDAAAVLVTNAMVDAAAAIALSKLAASGTNENVVKQSSGAITLGTVNLASSNAVSGTLPVARGGTNRTALGSGLQVLRTNAGATDTEWATITSTVDPTINGLRLTLTSATPVTTSDVASATTIYLTPFISGSIALYVSGSWVMRTTAEVSLALGTLTSDKNYDVFAYDNSGTVTLELSSAWTDDVTRATAVTTQDGVTVKSGDATRRLVGTIRTISTTQTCDTALKRFVWNGPEIQRQVRRHLLDTDTTDSWSGNTSSWAQARGSSTNQVAYVSGASYTVVQAYVAATASGASTSTNIAVGIGVDSTSANSAQLITASRSAAANSFTTVSATYDGYPGLGYHYLAWIEQVSNTATFYGDNGTTTMQSGLRASIAA